MTDCVIEVLTVNYNEVTRAGTVNAIIENFNVVYPATYDEPCEMGPALCSAKFHLDEEEEFPVNEMDLPSFFDKLDLRWEEIDFSDCDSE